MAEFVDVPGLLADLSPDKYPARWEVWYPEAVAEYEKNGCIWTKKETYLELEARYACFGDLLELYCSAAEECGKSEQLTLILMLLVRSLSDREKRSEELSQLSALKSPDPGRPLAFRMLTGLAAASEAEACARLLEKRGFGKERISSVLYRAFSAVNTYRRLYNGLDGFNLIDWCQLYFEGKLFDIGIFEAEFFRCFSGGYTVYENGEGIIKVLKDAADFTGFECFDGGTRSEETVSLDPDKWHVVLEGGSDVIGLHIPRGHRLEKAAVDASLEEINAFRKKYYPELNCRAFVCSSWLLSADLAGIMPEDTNIVRFSRSFFRYKVCGSGRDVFNFVFCLPEKRVILSDLPERTSLERALKRCYLEGGNVREMSGFILLKQ